MRVIDLMRRLFALSLLMWATQSAGAIYRCTDAAGKAVYQETPCAQGGVSATQSTSTPSKDEQAVAADVLSQVIKPRCLEDFPEYVDTTRRKRICECALNRYASGHQPLRPEAAFDDKLFGSLKEHCTTEEAATRQRAQGASGGAEPGAKEQDCAQARYQLKIFEETATRDGQWDEHEVRYKEKWEQVAALSCN